jgi:hypothetical protein
MLVEWKRVAVISLKRRNEVMKCVIRQVLEKDHMQHERKHRRLTDGAGMA